jgi:hypothetical protein
MVTFAQVRILGGGTQWLNTLMAFSFITNRTGFYDNEKEFNHMRMNHNNRGSFGVRRRSLAFA